MVPIGDLDLFSNYRICLNLGGFSNVSIKGDNTIKAFDICPVNTVLNHYSNKLGYAFDKDGALSKKGVMYQFVKSIKSNDMVKKTRSKISRN